MTNEIELLNGPSDSEVLNAFFYFGGCSSYTNVVDSMSTPMDKLLRPADEIDKTIYKALSKSKK